nr:Peptide (Capa-like) G protein-coupled receptor Partial [Hymenolepis microstoma]
MNLSEVESVNSFINSSEVTDIWEYLINIRGLRRTELELLIPISVIYTIIFTLGFFGNVILLWVILVNRSFHTPINCHLVNLSISDLLILVLGLPHDLYMMWNRYPYPFEEGICQLRAFLAEASMISSVLTITVLTIERYIAIVHPLSAVIAGKKRRNGSDGTIRKKNGDIFKCCREWGRFKKVRITVIVVWILSPLFSLPITMQVALNYIYRNDSTTNYEKVLIAESSICTVSNESDKWYSYPVLASFILFFLLPLIVIIILYILILRGVRRSVKFTQPLFLIDNRKRLLSPTGNNQSLEKSRKHSVSVIRRGRSISNQIGQDKNAARQHQELCQIQQAQHQARLRTNKALIRILVCIVVAFFTCFAPFHAERLLVVLMPDEWWYDNNILWKFHDVLYHISGICLFANSVCNPILYNIAFRRIRAEFMSALMCCGKRRRRQRIHYSYRSRNSCYRPSTIIQTPKSGDF